MIILSATTDKIQAVTSSVANVDSHITYADLTVATGAIAVGRQNTAISSATTTDILASPASGVNRNIKAINIRNKHASTSSVVTVQFDDNATLYELFKCTLLAGEELVFTDNSGWNVFDAAGGLKQAGRSGLYIKTTVLSSGTIFTTAINTNTIRVRMVGGGGQGGGCTVGSASISGAAGGGAGGGYAEKTFAVVPNTNYTYAIGAGGSTSGTGATTGQAGGNSTFAVGGTTVTCNGGPGGLGCTSAASVSTLGGASAAISTNGDLNMAGEPGNPGFVAAVGVAMSGNGGASPFGAGAVGLKAQGTGVSAATLGFGGGGGGGCTISTTGAVAGGAGAGGCIVVDEYM